MWYGIFFFVKHKTAYEMLISDWSSDVCSSDLSGSPVAETDALDAQLRRIRTGEQVTVGARGRQDRRTGGILAGQVQTLPIAKREAVGREIIGSALLEPALNIVVAAIFEEGEKCCRRAAIAGDSDSLRGGDVRYRRLAAPSCRHPHHLTTRG